jgi:endonuclease-8
VPEGDTLFRLAAVLRPALVGKKVIELRLPREDLGVGRRVVGHAVTAVEAKGKNLLIHFDEGTVLHTHLRMNGVWHLYPAGRKWRRSEERAVVVLSVEGFTAVCFQAPVVRLLREKAIATDPRLGALGPDVLAGDFDEDEAVRRLRVRDAQPLGVAIMDQHALAGVGNVFKSEILFIAKLDPFALVASASDDDLRRVVQLAVKLLGRNVRHHREPAQIDARWSAYRFERRVTRESLGAGTGLVYVYGRSGKRCTTCGDTIRMTRQGTMLRSTYYCPTCQRVGASASVPAPS